MQDSASESDKSLNNFVWSPCSNNSSNDSESSLDEMEMQKMLKIKEAKQKSLSKFKDNTVKDPTSDSSSMQHNVKNETQKLKSKKVISTKSSKKSLDKSPSSDEDEAEVRKIIENELKLKSPSKKIKEEPHSDDNQSPTKEKHKISSPTNGANKSELYSYLNKKVKEEQMSVVEPEEMKIERLLSNCPEPYNSSQSKDKSKSKKKPATKKNVSFEEGVKKKVNCNNVNNSSSSSDESTQKKLKKHKKSNISISDIKVEEISAILPNDKSILDNHMDHDHDDSSNEEESHLKKAAKKSKKESNKAKKQVKNLEKIEKSSVNKLIVHLQNNKDSDSSSGEEANSNDPKKKLSKSEVSMISNGEADEISAILPYEKTIEDSCINNDNDSSSDNDSGSNTMAKVPNKSVIKKDHEKKIYEDGNGPLDISIEKYHDMNPYLKPVTRKLPEGAIIKNHDEVWILNVPHNITIDMLKNTKLTIGTKCKMKIKDDTYFGKLDTGTNKSNLLTMDDGKCVIKNKKINGLIKLCKRLPKQRVVEENTAIEDSDIPLPTTKCRHPLFGSDYESAIIIPPAIKDKLDKEPAKSKKKKKHRQEKIEDESNYVPDKRKCKEIKEEVGQPMDESERIEEPVIKKKKKRKCTDEVDGQEHRSKKSKYNDVETWDNAQAIEDTLFNF